MLVEAIDFLRPSLVGVPRLVRFTPAGDSGLDSLRFARQLDALTGSGSRLSSSIRPGPWCDGSG